MNRTLKTLTLSAALVGFVAVPAQSQTGWGALGLHASWMNPGSHAKGPQEDLNFDETVGFGAGLDLWFGESRRWGLGAEGTMTRWSEWDTNFGGDFGAPVAIYQGDVSLQVRLATPDADTRFLPWLSLGGGAVMVNPDNGSGYPAPAEFEEADVRLNESPHSEWAVVGGLGLDYFFSPSVALRLEAKDYWTKDSPYFRLSNGERHDGGHNLLFNGGLAFYFGGRSVEEPGFVQEEPSVIVTPEPEPEPEPVEENITVCVIDEDGFAIETIQAVRVPTENRTYVTQNGQRVAFTTAYPASAPVYVRNATWYMNDQPMVIDLEADDIDMDAAERNRIELVLFGSPAQRSATDLVFVGTIGGTPVYASRMDVSGFHSRLQSHYTTTTDLEDILEGDAELAREFGTINTYYVAVEPNCMFQPVSVTHFVRRTRG